MLENSDAFWARIQIGEPDACWEWQRYCNEAGYGEIRTKDNRLLRAHRLAYELTYGPIPEGLFICHHCDNPPCCNPAHLFPGTSQDNVADMWSKGREPHNNGAKGTANVGAKLSDNDVRMIRQRYATGSVLQKILAQEYGITIAQISRIIRRATWQHIA
jgi:hypothetical protein